MSKGWIKLHRQIMDSAGYFEEPFCRTMAWIDLLLLANHKDKTIRKRGIRVIVERGQVGYSEKILAERWKWSRGKVRRFLNDLKTVQQIVHQKTNITTLITIVNYEQYKIVEHQNDQQTDTKRYTNKNDKNSINVLVKQNEQNEKKINGDFSAGETFIANRYGNKRPTSYFGAENDNESQI
jgi:DNA replication protein DnaD